MVTIAVQFLFHSQTITRFQCQGTAGFGSSGSRRTYYIATSVDVKAAVVDGIGNVACGGQFIGIRTSWSNHFAGRVAACAVTHVQCSSGGRYFVGGAAIGIGCAGYANAVACFHFGGGSSFGFIQLADIHGIRTIRAFGNISNLVAAVIQTAGSEAYGIAAACCRSDGHAAAVGNGLIAGRISSGHAGYVQVRVQSQLYAAVYGGAGDVAVAFHVNGVTQLVVVATGSTAEVDAFGHILVGGVQLAAVYSFGASGTQRTWGYVTQSHRAA